MVPGLPRLEAMQNLNQLSGWSNRKMRGDRLMQSILIFLRINSIFIIHAHFNNFAFRCIV